MTDRWDDLRERLQRAEAGQAGPDEAIGIPSAAVRGRTQGIRLALSYMDDADRAGPSLTSANEQVSEPTPDDLRERIRDTITESLRAIMRHGQCHEGVTREGHYQPCDKPAVAVRLDPEDETPYPVCAFHARGQMVPLTQLAQAVTND